MAYDAIGENEQTYSQGHVASTQSYELRPTAPSSTSNNGSLVDQNTPAHNNTASAHQRLLQGSHQKARGSKWRPGFFRQFPCLAILALLGVLGSTVASLVILIQSHEKPIDDWGYGTAPSVYLAVAAVLGNALNAYAMTCGLGVAFWRNALQGRTLAGINQNWLNGHSFYYAVWQGYRSGGRITALACIFSVLALLRGPLYQSASAVQTGVGYGISRNFQLNVAQKLPEGYTGLAVDGRSDRTEVGRLTPIFAEVMQGYSLRQNISLSHADCGTSCKASIIGFGFNTSCDFSEYDSVKLGFGNVLQPIFESSTSLYPISNKDITGHYYEDMGMRFNVTYRVPYSNSSMYAVNPPQNSTEGSIVTHLRSHICNLTGGSVEYNVRLSSQTVSLASNRSEDRFLEKQVLSGPGTDYHHSTIGGFEYAASYMFSSNALFWFRGTRNSIELTGSLVNEVIRGDDRRQDGSEATFEDPMSDMLDAIREIAFRTAVRAGRDKDAPTNVTNAEQAVAFEGSSTRSIYVTDFDYMIAATVISLASVLATSLLFSGFWHLGRTVSLAPLEIAKAFDAPLLAPVGSNVSLEDNEELGHAAKTQVRYGLRKEEIGQRKRLVFGAADAIAKPVKGGVYEN